MAKIKPFQAVIFNQAKIKDLSKVVCPPYDVISPAKQQYYHHLSPHNFIHILLGKDVPGDNKYKRAARYFRDWQERRILIQDEKPAMYFYRQDYYLKGKKRQRLGFIALLHLAKKNALVFGHEHTRLEPKEDRLRLLGQVRANLSPIFAVFSDRKRIIQWLYQQYIQKQKAFIDLVNSEGTRHKLWRLDAPKTLSLIVEKTADENIFIADGHHRYEVACAFRDEMKKKSGDFSQEESFNYILAYFTPAHSQDLTIMPIHRLVRFCAQFDFENFKSALADYFLVEEVSEKLKFPLLLEKAGKEGHAIGMYWQKKFVLLCLKNIKILDKIIQDKPKEYRSLDVAIFNYLVLKRLLGMDIEDKENVIFNHDAQELIKQADHCDNAAVFFLNPVKIEQLMSLAQEGQKLPSKSTFFYPKLLSGLVIHKFV